MIKETTPVGFLLDCAEDEFLEALELLVAIRAGKLTCEDNQFELPPSVYRREQYAHKLELANKINAILTKEG